MWKKLRFFVQSPLLLVSLKLIQRIQLLFDLPFVCAVMHRHAAAASWFSGEHLGIIHFVRLQNFQKTNISYSLIRNKRTCAYQGVRNVSFLENFAYVLNERSLMRNEKVDFCRVVHDFLVKSNFMDISCL